MTQNLSNAGDTANVSSADSPQFAQAMRMFTRLHTQGSFAQALFWARHAEQIGIALDENSLMPEVNEAYAQLVITCIRKIRATSLHSGNVYDAHASLIDVAVAATDNLVERFRIADKQLPYTVALLAQRFAQQVQETVLAHVQSKALVTSGELLDEILEGLDQIEENIARLTRTADELGPSMQEKVVLAATATSNASFELNWLLGSNWDKAEVFCRRSAILLTGNKNLTKAASTGNASVDAIVKQLIVACQRLKDHRYRDSKKLLKAIEAALKAVALERFCTCAGIG